MISKADIFFPNSETADTATSICAPYGMIPCVMQENVSSKEADFLADTPYVFAISRAIGFAITIATVLFAVATSIAATRMPIPI